VTGRTANADPAGKRASYGAVIATYLTLATATAVAVHRSGRRLPQPKLRDGLVLGLATFKASRIITKDKVLQPVRAPFVADTTPGEGAEVNSQPARGGLRGAIGELITCPFCLSVWIATAMIGAFAFSPRATRLAATGLASIAIADSTQYAYAALRRTA
jgi:hypothetical protein